MTTDRPYRGALQVEDAIAELRRCAGTQFDPRVVKAVVAVIERRTGRTFGDSALLPEPGSLLRQPTQ
jgi:HD-GYP domain-containing protein (c-di-GMP phosphodiesterase class II)